jgi:ribonuclease P protein component
MRHGTRSRDPILHLAARANDLPYTRVGYAVNRKVGGAVVRNRVRRRLREIIRQLPLRSGYDVVAVPQPLSASASFEDLSCATVRTARKLRLIPLEDGLARC